MSILTFSRAKVEHVFSKLQKLFCQFLNKEVMVMVIVMVTLFIHGKAFSKDYKEIKDEI